MPDTPNIILPPTVLVEPVEFDKQITPPTELVEPIDLSKPIQLIPIQVSNDEETK